MNMMRFFSSLSISIVIIITVAVSLRLIIVIIFSSLDRKCNDKLLL